MKKMIMFLAVASVLFVSLTVTGCKKKEADNCSDLVSRADAAGLTYSTNPTVANCQAYKSALNNLLNCSAITSQERTVYQQLFNQLTC